MITVITATAASPHNQNSGICNSRVIFFARGRASASSQRALTFCHRIQNILAQSDILHSTPFFHLLRPAGQRRHARTGEYFCNADGLTLRRVRPHMIRTAPWSSPIHATPMPVRVQTSDRAPVQRCFCSVRD